METSGFISEGEKPEKVELLQAGGATAVTYIIGIDGKLYFMKRLRPELQGDKRYRDAFYKEYETGKTIDSPYIVKYVDIKEDKEGLYILTEYVNGCTLSEKLEKEPGYFSQNENLKRFIQQLCQALATLHSKNVVHLDISPSNILFSQASNDIKLIDLGFCLSDYSNRTAGCTKGFSAPETNCGNKKEIDARSDIYALGCLLKYIEDCGIKLPGNLRKIQKRCIEQEKEKRYQNVEEIVAELKKRKQKRVAAIIAIAAIAVYLLSPFAIQAFNAYREYLAWENGEIPDKFEEGGIFYRVTDHDARTVEVTFKGSHPDEYTYEYKGGRVDIPATVTHRRRTFQVKSIASYFCKNEYISRISIAEGVDTIHKNAFTICLLSDTVRIPASVKFIGQEAFTPHAYIKSFVVDAGNKVYDSRGGCNAIIERATNTLLSGCKNTIIPGDIVRIERCAFENLLECEEIALPPSIRSIGEYAFYRAEIKRVIIPEGITDIEKYTFQWCERLQQVQLPQTLRKIGHAAFSHCAFRELIIPDSVTAIEDYAFDCNSNLQTITIGSSVRSIGYAAFENCDSLYHIYNHAATPPSITSILNNPNTVIHVPAESAELYKQHPQWAVYNIAGDL